MKVEGECAKPATYNIEDILKWFPLEERIYRLRCVEAWSMVIPWIGFPLGDFIKRMEPTAKAKYVEFRTLVDFKQMPGQTEPALQWPYREGLRMDEAMHPLAILAVGLYGEVLPNQNGAPIRLVVPWKYGFKSIKSIVSVKFTEREPLNTWQQTSAAASTASTPTSTRPSITRAGRRPPSGASASSSAARRCRSTATATRWRRSTPAWTCGATTDGSAVIRFLKPALFLACLGPAAWLVYGAFLGGDLGVNPVETITNYTGIWTLRLIAISLAVSPLRWLTGWNRIIQYRRMLGLFAFFYGTLHFMTYFVLDHSLVFAGLWDDVVKRPYITAGFTAFMLLIPLAITSTQGWIRRLGGRRLEPAAPAGLRHGAARRAALLVEGEARHLESGALRGDHGRAARRPGLEGAGEASCRAAGVASGARGAAGLMARLAIAALATVAVLAGCAPAGDGAEAEAPRAVPTPGGRPS